MLSRIDDADDGEESQGVAAHDSGGGVGEPEEGDGDGDAGDGDLPAQNGVEQEWDERGGEELGVGGALVGGEEHVGVHRIEDRGDGGGCCWGEFACEEVEA